MKIQRENKMDGRGDSKKKKKMGLLEIEVLKDKEENEFSYI